MSFLYATNYTLGDDSGFGERSKNNRLMLTYASCGQYDKRASEQYLPVIPADTPATPAECAGNNRIPSSVHA